MACLPRTVRAQGFLSQASPHWRSRPPEPSRRASASSRAVEVPAKANFYKVCGEVASKLQDSPEVVLRAGGRGAALRVLRLAAFASQELQKTNGYLPGFGWLVLRPQRFALPREPGSGQVLGTVARILAPPTPEGGERPPATVLRAESAVTELAELVVARLAEGEGAVTFRLVGEAPADCMFQVLMAAQKLLNKSCKDAHGAQLPSGPLVLAPGLGTSLSTLDVLRQELMASICHWTELAPPLPGPVHERARHFPSFLKKHTDWVDIRHKEE